MDVDLLLHPSLSRKGPAYIAGSIASTMQSSELACNIFTGYNRWTGKALPNKITTAFPDFDIFRKIPNRVMASLCSPVINAKLKRSLRERRQRPVIWAFGPLDPEAIEGFKQLGAVIFREKYNCAQATAKHLLDAAYSAAGLPATAHGITDRSIAKENAGLHAVDYIFCPSPMVAASLRDLGIADDRLIKTSYGWDVDRFRYSSEAAIQHPKDGTNLIYVGYVCIRKGAHILLEAWRRARIGGSLTLVGAIEPFLKEKFGYLLDSPGVVYLPYTESVATLYLASDWFVFPTFEEGGPLVTYEAAACGLPGIVSQMGAGAFTRNGVDGIVVPEISAEIWSEVIASLPSRSVERQMMASSARERAKEFTWEEVGAKRRDSVLSRFLG